MSIFQDVRVAIRLTGEVRKAMKEGASGVKLQKFWDVPFVNFGYWGFTMEACLFSGPKWQPLRDVFNSFNKETQHTLTFTPKDGEWGNRVRFWKKALYPALEPRLYHEAILTIIQWYIQCRRRCIKSATSECRKTA